MIEMGLVHKLLQFFPNLGLSLSLLFFTNMTQFEN